MKEKLCKILLAVSFLFLVSDFCMGQNLKGIWKLIQDDNTAHVTTRYKVFDKGGNYYNVDAYIKMLLISIRTAAVLKAYFALTKSLVQVSTASLAKVFIVRNCVMSMEVRRMLLCLYLIA